MRSQPRSLLSMARLNMARSRVRFSSCNLARIAQTWPGRNGGFGPGILPCSRPVDPTSALMEDCCHSWSVSQVERPCSLRSRENNR